jgi:hypothetical protein
MPGAGSRPEPRRPPERASVPRATQKAREWLRKTPNTQRLEQKGYVPIRVILAHSTWRSGAMTTFGPMQFPLERGRNQNAEYSIHTIVVVDLFQPTAAR